MREQIIKLVEIIPIEFIVQQQRAIIAAYQKYYEAQS